ncbi:PepSY domain-containing protein [Adhaeribacter rhizoryzae]|uniref:NADPH--hemoprotein reductase n=1 Tax=Adhaeribacter rhizoryzae TaxID=2607907 RepID=A0A5M6D8S5_9BACT|nr:PepSY domain-containing protein [Adhaeribacter rhizoryzae]KAA5542319.1 FAD-binding oxidoreductase [Adhaeribacter rhizoryzae]
MTISIWRYSHLALAVSSFLLLLLASVTGVILAFEPVAQKIQPYHTAGFEQASLAQTLPLLRSKYPGISELTVNHHQFVIIKGSDNKGENLEAYIDPQTGKILGTPEKQSEFFLWVTDLHRSLFIHETGRFIIGLTAFLLLLIAVSGTMLIIQRQRGIKRFFTRIVKENAAQYYHVVLGRLSLIPIILIAGTGTYLSLVRFEIIPPEKVATEVDFDAIKEEPRQEPASFAIFKNTLLSEVQSVEFPFSDDPEDYYTLKLKDREVAVNQLTGEILSEAKYPTAQLLTELSLDLHTGRTNIIWAIILAVASGNILFFIYSGFKISFRRRAKSIKNKYTLDESRFIILVGSENGNTFRFARAIQQQLIKHGQKPFLTELNNYTLYPQAEHLIILTATYGLGDPPTNAKRFVKLLQTTPQAQPVRYSVIGFGSHKYADFCKFAFEVNQMLSHQAWATPLLDMHTVNDRSPEEFSLWAEAWSQQAGIALAVLPELRKTQTKRFETLTVAANTCCENTEGTFLIRFQPKRKIKFTSGDLLAIYPANDHRERLYSIGLVQQELQVSVRLLPDGLGSGFLHRLKPGDTIPARIIKNDHFHFPKKATGVLMIANGTGIGPFLGMICQNSQQTPIHLYGGFRDRESCNLYKPFLEENKTAQRLTQLHLALSREGEKQYVSDLISRDADLVANLLATGGVIMICGSLAMQKDVTAILENICQTKLNQNISYYQSRSQLLTDCY